MKINMYPGTFDPITNGHMDIIQRALKFSDMLIIGVLNNPSKSARFTVDERIEMIRDVTKVNLLKKVRIEIAVNEDFVEPTINAIIKGARTGEIGDGKIFVLDLPECIRIRTGETGGIAIG